MAQTGKKRSGTRGSKQTKADTPKVQAAPTETPALPGLPPPGSALVPVSPPIAAERALQERQRKQKWSSKHLPKRNKMRTTVAAILALKVQGLSTAEIAEHLKIKPASVRQYLFIAGREGWLDTRDPHEIVHSKLVHRAVSNLEEWMTARDARTGLPDKEVMLETTKLFFGNSSGNAMQSDAQQTNVLAISITMPQGANLPTMRQGNADGAPAYVEGEVLNASSQPGRQHSE